MGTDVCENFTTQPNYRCPIPPRAAATMSPSPFPTFCRTPDNHDFRLFTGVGEFPGKTPFVEGGERIPGHERRPPVFANGRGGAASKFLRESFSNQHACPLNGKTW